MSGACAFVALALVMALAPAEAQGGCTHPWTTLAKATSDARLGELALLQLAGRSVDGVLPKAPSPENGPSPCAGGRCSPAPESPAGTLPPTPPPRRDTQGYLPGTVARDRNVFVYEAPGTPPLHPILSSKPLDRPPRLTLPSRSL